MLGGGLQPGLRHDADSGYGHSLTSKMKKKFTVAAVARDGRFRHAGADQSYLSGAGRHFLHHARVHRGIADHSLFSHFRTAGLELRLHQRDDVRSGTKEGKHAWKNV